ncbi:hypothetical protein [Desulfolucanica intricata]|uniref:hypothetical protein n=1 Tax=Desulfolucanica intricata TaxID=1285191 RepID=UPI0008337467|nr:hypothetical protein [Desulfolucanica intricata]
MLHPTNTRIVFADSEEEARAKYQELGIKPKYNDAKLECFKAVEEEDFDLDAEMNFIGEISVGPPVMAEIRKDPPRAYVLYYMEDSSSGERA